MAFLESQPSAQFSTARSLKTKGSLRGLNKRNQLQNITACVHLFVAGSSNTNITVY